MTVQAGHPYAILWTTISAWPTTSLRNASRSPVMSLHQQQLRLPLLILTMTTRSAIGTLVSPLAHRQAHQGQIVTLVKAMSHDPALAVASAFIAGKRRMRSSAFIAEKHQRRPSATTAECPRRRSSPLRLTETTSLSRKRHLAQHLSGSRESCARSRVELMSATRLVVATHL